MALFLTTAAAAPASTQMVGSLVAPFEGDFGLTGVYDHDATIEGQTTFWGSVTAGPDGHGAYDWALPKGTAVMAAAAGTVLWAGPVAPFECPLAGGLVTDQVEVKVLHSAPRGADALLTTYVHLSSVAVSAGDIVEAGQVIGRSGSSGCSSGPHLHFETWLAPGGDLLAAQRIDPFAAGANGDGLWAPGAAPALYREKILKARDLSQAVTVGIWKLRWMGRGDQDHPNNEVLVLQIRPDGPDSADLSGWSLTNRHGETLVFPPATQVLRGVGLEVRSGRGEGTSASLYWGRDAPVWDDRGDCAALRDAAGELVHRMGVGPRGGRCGQPDAAALEEGSNPASPDGPSLKPSSDR